VASLEKGMNSVVSFLAILKKRNSKRKLAPSLYAEYSRSLKKVPELPNWKTLGHLKQFWVGVCMYGKGRSDKFLYFLCM